MQIFESAYRHGLTDEDILHAWQHAMGFYDIDSEHEPTKSLCTRYRSSSRLPARSGPAAEQDLVVHAMPLRPVFRTYLTGE